jgi:Flp pilus assembly protein TadD
MKAFELLRKSYEAHPEDLKVATQLSQLYDRMGNQSKACEIYAAIVSADATAVAPAVNLGTCLAREGRIPRSIELWEGALKRNPGLESARTNLAVALAGTGNVEGAKSALREGLKFDPLSTRLQALLQQFESKSFNNR